MKLLAANTQPANSLAAPTNRRSKSEGLEVELRDLTSTQKETLSQGGATNVPPKTFQDILPPQLITTSTLSEASYMGYRKSKFKSTRSSTFPPPHTSSRTLKHVGLDQPTDRRDHPPAATSRRSTLKKMKGVIHSIKRSISSLNDPKKKIRPPMPSSSAFAPKSPRSRFGTGPGRQSFGRQDGGYLNLSDGEVAVGEEPPLIL